MSIIFIIVSVFLLGMAFYVPYYFGEFEAEHDAIKYGFIGSANPNSNPYHRFNIIKRSIMAGFCIVVFTIGLMYFAGFHKWFALFYLVYFPAAFGFNYTRKLNEARGLHSWYVSGSAKSRRFDKNIRRWAYKFKKTPQEFNQLYHFYFFIIAGAALISWIFFELVFSDWIIKIK